MKLKERSSQGLHGTGNGHNNPAIFYASYLVYWQSKHAATNCLTSFRIPIQVKFSLKRAMVLVTPIWASVGQEWYSSNNVGMKENP